MDEPTADPLAQSETRATNRRIRQLLDLATVAARPSIRVDWFHHPGDSSALNGNGSTDDG